MQSIQDKEIKQDKAHQFLTLTKNNSSQNNEVVQPLQEYKIVEDQIIKNQNLEVIQQYQEDYSKVDDSIANSWKKGSSYFHERQQDCKKITEDFQKGIFSNQKFISEQPNDKLNQNNSIQQIQSQEQVLSQDVLEKQNKNKKLENQNKVNLQYESRRNIFIPKSRGDINLAKLHQQAKKIKKLDFRDVKNDDLCDCCGLPFEGQKYSLNCSVDEFASFGLGFSLYFIYLKFVIILLALGFFPFGFTLWIQCFQQNNEHIKSLGKESLFQLRSSIGNFNLRKQLPVYFGIFQLVILIIMTFAVIFFK